MPSSAKIRRAKPLLGTLVEISLEGEDLNAAAAAMDAGFAAVERVQRLMSFHDSESDLSRLNACAASEPVVVDPWTYDVLAFSVELFRRSGGLFDVAVGARLVDWSYLPCHRGRGEPAPLGSTDDIELLGDQRVRFRCPLSIDLGGVAKGFAVDRAGEAILHCGMPDGVVNAVVNAGGDLRVWGCRKERAHVRLPEEPSGYVMIAELENEALATSCPSLSTKELQGRVVSPLLRRGVPFISSVSYSVRAPTCVAADALTKVVIGGGEELGAILELYGARAYRIEGRGIATLEESSSS